MTTIIDGTNGITTPSPVVLNGATSGSVTLAAPAVAGSNTVTFPAATGSVVVGSSAVSAAGQIPFSTDGVTYTPTQKIVLGTAVATTSGTAVDFTGIPATAKRITIMLVGFSTNGASNPTIQIGAGSIDATNYIGGAATGSSAQAIGTGFAIFSASAANTISGSMFITLAGSNTWVANGMVAFSTGGTAQTAGYKTLSGTLDRIRITTVNGTDTFDAGSVNIMWE